MGVEGVELRMNSLGCPECRARYNKTLKEFIGQNLDKLCPTCKERFEKNPLRVLDCKEEGCQQIMANAPSVLDCLDEECTAHFQKVQDILTANGIAFTIDPKIVRGLDYYTRTVFEFVSDGLTVCGGGRYDNLVEEIGGKPTGAVGFGLGIERLIMILEKQHGAITETPERDVYIGSMGEKGLLKAQSLTYELRKAGIQADCDTVERSVKAQMKYANKIGAKYSVILGDSELESGRAEGYGKQRKERGCSGRFACNPQGKMRKIKQKQNEYRALGEPSFKASFLLAGRQRFSLPCSLERSCIFGNKVI